jgi:Flp pilus assembly protein TadG
MLHTLASTSSPRRSRRGNAVVEFALLMPVIVVLGLSTIEWGWYITRREIVVAVVQDATMAGVCSTGSPDADAIARARAGLNAAGLDGAGATVTIAGSGAAGSLYTVTISAAYTPLVGVSVPGALTSQHTMLFSC